jgi:hypothetical protein
MLVTLRFFAFLLTVYLGFVTAAGRGVNVGPDGSVKDVGSDAPEGELGVPGLQQLFKVDAATATNMLAVMDEDRNGFVSEEEFHTFQAKMEKEQRKAKGKLARTQKKSPSPSSSPVRAFSPAALAMGSTEQQAEARFMAVQKNMMNSIELLVKNNMMEFMHTATTVISEAEGILRSLTLEDTTTTIEGKPDVWPKWAVHMYAMTAKFIHTVADSLSSDRDLLRRALVLQKSVLEHTPEGTVEYQEALVEASQLYVEDSDFCIGIQLLVNFTSLRGVRGEGAGYRDALLALPDRSKQQFTLASHRCDPPLSLELFGHLMDIGYLDPAKPETCTKCWKVWQGVLKEMGQAEVFTDYFETQLRPHVPWIHKQQLPSGFNSLLATKKPEFYWSPATASSENEVPLPPTERLLHKHRDTLIEEYTEYERRVAEDDDATVHPPQLWPKGRGRGGVGGMHAPPSLFKSWPREGGGRERKKKNIRKAPLRGLCV